MEITINQRRFLPVCVTADAGDVMLRQNGHYVCLELAAVADLFAWLKEVSHDVTAA